MQQSSRNKATPVPLSSSLNFEQVYTCPVCRHGQISAIVLMDAFACNFCHHIFTANLQTQSIQVVDSTQPMAWRWNGQGWLAAHQGNADLTWLVWSVGSVLVVLPPALIGLASYMFPSGDNETWYFPLIWTGTTFGLHFTLVAWLIAEHHQFPPYIMLKVRLQELLGRR